MRVDVPWAPVSLLDLWLPDPHEDPADREKLQSQTQSQTKLFDFWVENTYRWTSLPSRTRFTCNALLDNQRKVC